MNARIALITGAAAALAASLSLGLGDVRAFAGDDDDQKVEKRVVVRHARGGRLGVTIGDTTGDARGAAVRSVAEGSAALKAGIKEGDVIVRFDGETVRGADQLSRLVAETPAGRPIAIEVTRGGATQKLTATLAEGGQGMRAWNFEMPDWEMSLPHPPAAPHPPLPPAAPHAPMAWSFRGDGGRDLAFNLLSGGPRKLGIEYMELGEQLASYFKLAGKSGVLVTSVDADGPAAKAGLKAGDAIVKLGADSIADGDDLRDALSEAEGGSEIAITVQRDGRPVELKVTLAKPEERRKHREARGVSL